MSNKRLYVPGVAPINFHQNDPVEIKAVKLTSSRTQLPYEYYSLPFCQPRKITYKAENLGEVLRGDRIVNTPFQVLMNSEKKCEVLCSQSSKPVTLTVEQSKLVVERITEDYYVHLIADNLPVATRLELYSNRDSDDKKKEKDVQFEHGYRLGFTDVNKFYLHNHLSFILYYHREDMEEDQEHTYRVVRFEVIPRASGWRTSKQMRRVRVPCLRVPTPHLKKLTPPRRISYTSPTLCTGRKVTSNGPPAGTLT